MKEEALGSDASQGSKDSGQQADADGGMKASAVASTDPYMSFLAG